MLYINKVRRYADGITEAHMIDDDCNEYKITTKSFLLDHTYYGEDEIAIDNKIKYSDSAWNTIRA